MGRGFVTATAYGEGAPAGTYVYDLDASRLVRISTASARPGRTASPVAGPSPGRSPVCRDEVKIFAGRWKGAS